MAVVYATPSEQPIVELELEPGMTALEAVQRSGLLERYPEIGARPLVLGIYGQAVPPDRALAPGDRVEICRPLLTDPRDLRRDLVAGGRVMGGGRGADAPAARRRGDGTKPRAD